jgi:hypothetical protein
VTLPSPGKMNEIGAPARQQPPGAVTEPDGSRPVCPRVRARSTAARISSTPADGVSITTGAGTGTVIRSAASGGRLTGSARKKGAINRALPADGVECTTGAGACMAIRRSSWNGHLSSGGPSILAGWGMRSVTGDCMIGYARNAGPQRLTLARMRMKRARDAWSGRTSRMSTSGLRTSCRSAGPITSGMTGRPAYGD